MNEKVSVVVIVAMVLTMIAGVIIPVATFLILKKKLKGKFLPALFGVLTMFVWAFTLEQILHSVVLVTPIGKTLTDNIWLYGLYGAFCAATFEEVGRFITMRFLLKKYHNDRSASVMYGIGHGGFECAYLLVIGMINNLVFVTKINTGAADQLTAGLAGTALEQVEAAMQAVLTVNAAMFAVSVFERICAIALQIAMSIFMWQAATKNKWGYFALAFGFHFAVDFVSVILGKYFGVAVTECAVAIIAIAGLTAGVRIYRKNVVTQSSEA